MSGADLPNPLADLGLQRGAEPSALTKVAISVVEPFEQFYATVGAKAPYQRFALGFAVASVVMFLTEPSYAFDQSGRPYPFAQVGLSHWSVVPAAFGLASALFV